MYKSLLFIVAVLINSPAYPQEAKIESVDVSIVDVVSIDRTIKAVSVLFDGETLENDLVLVKETKTDSKAAKIDVIANVDQEFITVTASNIVDGKIVNKRVPVFKDKTYLFHGSPGSYSLRIDVYDAEKGIDLEFVDIVLPGKVVDPDPDDPEEPDQPNPDVGDFAELAKLASDLARQMDDEPTRQAIVSELGKTIFTLTNTTVNLEEAIAEVQGCIVRAMATRIGPSLKKDWFKGWREPLNEKFEELGITTKANFIEAWSAILKQMTTDFKTVIPQQTFGSIPVWTPPVGRFKEGRIHNGRILSTVCEGGVCRLEWLPLKR